jgi:ribulose-5-phosphate 4-epimerase/fuculose-1-phosphate aldolase
MNYYLEMKNIGKMLEERGLVASSHSGNLSVRIDGSMYIKKTGAMLGALTEEDKIKNLLMLISL